MTVHYYNPCKCKSFHCPCNEYMASVTTCDFCEINDVADPGSFLKLNGDDVCPDCKCEMEGDDN